jgi:hypothetical protein
MLLTLHTHTLELALNIHTMVLMLHIHRMVLTLNINLIVLTLHIHRMELTLNIHIMVLTKKHTQQLNFSTTYYTMFRSKFNDNTLLVPRYGRNTAMADMHTHKHIYTHTRMHTATGKQNPYLYEGI